MMDDLKRQVDERLRDVRWTENDSRRVRERIAKKEKKMKKKFALVMTLALAVLMTATAVAAVALKRSESNGALAQARRAVAEKYGLSAETLGMLNGRAEKTQSGWIVTLGDDGQYLSSGLDCGVYTVTLEKNETQVFWNGDAVQGKGGQAEMRAYLERVKRGETGTVQAQAPLTTPAAAIDQPDVVWKLQNITLYADDAHAMQAAIGYEEAKEMLAAALAEEYGITEADFAAAYGWSDGCFRNEDEEGFWPLCRDAAGKGYYALHMLAEHDGIQLDCSGVIDAMTGEILATFAESGGNG